MILNKLMEIYGGLKGYENAIECAQKGIETCRQEQSSIYLVQFLEGNAQNIRRLLKQGETNEYSEETYREASLQAIAIASALGNEKSKEDDKALLQVLWQWAMMAIRPTILS